MTPPSAALDHLDARLAPVRDRVGVPRWAGRGGQHLTLAFFGEVPDARLDALTSALDAALTGHPTVHLRLAGAGTFPERGMPRVLWVGVDGDVEQLARMARSATLAARSAGVPVERRPYHPHLTVGRWRAAGPVDRTVTAALAGYAGPHFAVDDVVLIRSQLGPRPSYETLASWPAASGSGQR